MIHRHIEQKFSTLAKQFPIVVVTGPRQSGKTTLTKIVFPKYRYVSLENPDMREFAIEDPRGFLAEYEHHVIIDEIQRAPDLLFYLQTTVDEESSPGRYLLTGSQQFHLLSKVSQSLAGRAAYLTLLPFSVSELRGSKPQDPYEFFHPSSGSPPSALKLDDVLFQGLYPRIYHEKPEPRDFLDAYLRTYVERDVRDVLKIGDLLTFRKFVQLCAGRSGRILNLSSLASDCGITHPTARHWLSVLETSSIVYLVPPFYKNYSKRIIKSPKLYFVDTGLLCSLLKIRHPADLRGHPLYGSIFETFIVSEFLKAFLHAGERSPLYFWRDHTGHEVDLVLDFGSKICAVEIKAGKTISPDYFKSLKYFSSLKGFHGDEVLVYGGNDHYLRENVRIRTWWQVS